MDSIIFPMTFCLDEHGLQLTAVLCAMYGILIFELQGKSSSSCLIICRLASSSGTCGAKYTPYSYRYFVNHLQSNNSMFTWLIYLYGKLMQKSSEDIGVYKSWTGSCCYYNYWRFALVEGIAYNTVKSTWYTRICNTNVSC